jgi:hypothetical protein
MRNLTHLCMHMKLHISTQSDMCTQHVITIIAWHMLLQCDEQKEKKKKLLIDCGNNENENLTLSPRQSKTTAEWKKLGVVERRKIIFVCVLADRGNFLCSFFMADELIIKR